jgi:hypothetical protein
VEPAPFAPRTAAAEAESCRTHVKRSWMYSRFKRKNPFLFYSFYSVFVPFAIKCIDGCLLLLQAAAGCECVGKETWH